MRWFKITGEIPIISAGKTEQCVKYCLQTSGKDLFEGFKGFLIRPIVPWDRGKSGYNLKENKLKYLLFFPMSWNRLPQAFHTIREAKAFATAEHEAWTDVF